MPITASNLASEQISGKFQQAFALHQQGQLAQARIIYEAILNIQPRHFDSLHLLGMVEYQSGNPQRALKLINKAIGINPDFAIIYSNRGLVQQELKQFDAALASYDKAIALKPDYAEAYFFRGQVLHKLDQPDRSLESYDKAIAIKADFAEAYSNRGVLLQDLNQMDRALESYDKAIAIKADYAEANYNRGLVLQLRRQLDAAVESYDKAIAIKPDYAEAYNNRGLALHGLNQLDRALESYDKVIALKSDHAEAYSNRGLLLHDLNQLDSALANYDKAIALKPDYTEAYINKSLTLLLGGDFANGWELYEWRWKSARAEFSSMPLQSNRPEWQVGDEKGRLLIWDEQGIGDQIMFGSLLSKSKMLSSQTLVRIDSRLVPLFERSMPGIDFFPSNKPVNEEAYDRHMPMGSLGKYLCNDPESFKSIRPSYLLADKEKTGQIRGSLCAGEVKLCGISWRSSNHLKGRNRNIDLNNFIRILGKTNVKFVNLQYGEVAEELNEVKESMGVEVLQCPTVDNYNDLDGFASLIDACDLVISIDNSTVHLSGALGKPTWILLPRVPDWRWQLDREDSPWYPSVKLYRQSKYGEWDDVFQRVKSDLRSFNN